MDKIINILLLTIIFVFDPLAIALVVAANFAFEQIRRPNSFIPNPIRIRQPKKEPIIKTSVPEGMEFNKPYPIPKSWLDPKDKEYDASEGLDEMLEKEKSALNEEKRMDVIGQNGNDGLHYDKLDLNKDGKVDINEKKKELEELKKKAEEEKISGNDAQYEIYLKRIKSLSSKLPKDPDNKKDYW